MKNFPPVTALIIFSVASLLGQDVKTVPSPTPTPADDFDVVRISTKLVQVDVTVTDGKGKIVRDLRPDEIEIYQNGTRLGSNDNWKDSDQANISATGLAPTRDSESAIVLTLSPGEYTTVLRGKGNTTGNAVIEAYDLD